MKLGCSEGGTTPQGCRQVCKEHTCSSFLWTNLSLSFIMMVKRGISSIDAISHRVTKWTRGQMSSSFFPTRKPWLFHGMEQNTVHSETQLCKYTWKTHSSYV